MDKGPFDITDMFGTDRLRFKNKFSGPTSLATPQLAERAEEEYREATVHTSEANEFKSNIKITGKGRFVITVEVFQPRLHLPSVRDVRNELDFAEPNATLTEVEIESVNVGLIERDRAVLSKDIWILMASQKIIDESVMDIKQAGIIESKIRRETNINEKINMKRFNSNIAIDLNTRKIKMHKLINFASDARKIIKDELDIKRLDATDIAPADKLDFSF